MTIVLSYPHEPQTGAPHPLQAEALWRVTRQLRAALAGEDGCLALQPQQLATAVSRLVVNQRPIQVNWDFAHAVHDATGREVFGICETDPSAPGIALVSVNGRLLAHRPELELSTVAHEIGHIVFDVPTAADRPERRYRSVTECPRCLDGASARSERRANEFMGALLVPPDPLHVQLVAHARSEGLRLVHAPHRGRQGFRVLPATTPPDVLAGLTAVLAGDFGVSDRFIAVRLRRYRLIAGGLS